MPSDSSEEAAGTSEETPDDSIELTQSSLPSPPVDLNVTRTRSGRISRPPEIYSLGGQNSYKFYNHCITSHVTACDRDSNAVGTWALLLTGM